MGAHSTLRISREAALKKYYEITRTKELTNSELERFLDDHFYDNLYNFSIMPSWTDDEELDDDTFIELIRYEK